jgi:tryptophan-rich sensory protein
MTPFPQDSLARPRRLALHVAAAVAVCLALNGLIFCVGWDRDAHHGVLLPPGWVIGIVWIALFALLGAARWRLAEAGTRAGDTARRRVDVLLLNCALYPFYTLGLSSDGLGMAGNILTLCLAVWAARGALRVSRLAAVLVSPVVSWVAFATIGFMQELWGQG